jgi:hypothetical protein
LPTDPNDPKAFIDVFTDVSGLFVINNESGWYEGWMIHDITVPQVAPPRSDGSGNAQFGTITAADASALKALGSGNNVPGNIFTTDGNAVHLPSPSDHFPDVQTNTVGFPVSIGVSMHNNRVIFTLIGSSIEEPIGPSRRTNFRSRAVFLAHSKPAS